MAKGIVCSHTANEQWRGSGRRLQLGSWDPELIFLESTPPPLGQVFWVPVSQALCCFLEEHVSHSVILFLRDYLVREHSKVVVSVSSGVVMLQ